MSLMDALSQRAALSRHPEFQRLRLEVRDLTRERDNLNDEARATRVAASALGAHNTLLVEWRDRVEVERDHAVFALRRIADESVDYAEAVGFARDALADI